MKMYNVNSEKIKNIAKAQRTPLLIEQLVAVWEKSVRQTHLFLTEEAILQIKMFIPEALAHVEQLIIVEDVQNQPIAFMGIETHKLEMLFIAPKCRGRGIGKTLVRYGIENHAINEVTVNEQNPQAIGFYEHLGFTTYKRTAMDEQGNPYPLLYMRYCR